MWSVSMCVCVCVCACVCACVCFFLECVAVERYTTCYASVPDPLSCLSSALVDMAVCSQAFSSAGTFTTHTHTHTHTNTHTHTHTLPTVLSLAPARIKASHTVNKHIKMTNQIPGNCSEETEKTWGTTKWGLLAVGSQAAGIWWTCCEDMKVNTQGGEASVLKATNNDVIYTRKHTARNKIYDAKYWCVRARFEVHPVVNYKESTRSP